MRRGKPSVRLRWTPTASRNLEAIEDRIERDNPLAAVEVVLEILRRVEALKDHPGLGRPGRVEGTRELVITGLPYIVPYLVEGEQVIILRVLHAARKWPKKF